MTTPLLIAATVFVALAALIHVFIFVMESVTWRQPATWRRFGIRSQGEADTVQPMAFNQGFYNLFLAIGATIGLVLLWLGHLPAGAALVLLAAGSMVAAALVLVLSSPRLARAAALQGTAPLIGVVLTIVALVS